jgi:hypothetical protein
MMVTILAIVALLALSAGNHSEDTQSVGTLLRLGARPSQTGVRTELVSGDAAQARHSSHERTGGSQHQLSSGLTC